MKHTARRPSHCGNRQSRQPQHRARTTRKARAVWTAHPRAYVKIHTREYVCRTNRAQACVLQTCIDNTHEAIVTRTKPVSNRKARQRHASIDTSHTITMPVSATQTTADTWVRDCGKSTQNTMRNRAPKCTLRKVRYPQNKREEARPISMQNTAQTAPQYASPSRGRGSGVAGALKRRATVPYQASPPSNVWNRHVAPPAEAHTGTRPGPSVHIHTPMAHGHTHPRSTWAVYALIVSAM